MSDRWKNLLLMRMQIAWFCMFSINALVTASLAALAGTKIAEADTQTRWMIGFGIFASWTNTIMALFSKAMARVQDGELPFVEDTTTTQKTTQTTVQTTETKTLPQDTTKPPTQSP